ncbi:AAA family ATPase [Novosphingobium mathurense]|uniref:AAA domain-containing protein n=1 Tax=Novosphingobium mathurense TaxID=428990 RepID=A0A1U6IHL9_9SPHN|nr:AAA family ATPase [Novosphingobium mathurense]SLK07514.1 AAA domain-containing protein [Novosphingobium mathurense]
MSGETKGHLQIKGKNRRHELHAAIMDWRLRGMSKAQVRSMAELLDTTANAPPLADDAFADVFKQAWKEASEIAAAEHFKDLAEFETLPVEYLIEPLVPVGCTTIIDGNPGMGKSFLSLAMTAAITSMGMFGDLPVARQGRVLLLNDEDDPSRVLRPRLEAIGADIGRVRVIHAPFELDESGVDILRREIRNYDPTLVVIDPLTNFMPSGVDMYRPNEANAFMRPLHRLAKDFDIGILIARHLRKQASDTAMHMGQGSMAFGGAVRSGMIVTPHPTQARWRVLAHYKASYAEEAVSQAFEIGTPPRGGAAARVNWRGPVEMSANELVAQSSVQETMLDRAVRALEDYLAPGPAKARDVIEAMKKKGVQERTLDRAKKKLGVISGHGPGAKWKLPN